MNSTQEEHGFSPQIIKKAMGKMVSHMSTSWSSEFRQVHLRSREHSFHKTYLFQLLESSIG